MTAPAAPPMPDPARLVTRSIHAAMRTAGLSEYQAAVAVEAVATVLHGETPLTPDWAYLWSLEVLQRAVTAAQAAQR